MGQYWKLVNLDKKEYVHPHRVGCGLKLGEQISSHPGTGTALLILCAAMPASRGNGDLQADPGVVGRWAGDRIALVGDYAEHDDLPDEFEAESIYKRCSEDGDYEDITDMIVPVIERELNVKFVNPSGGWGHWVDLEDA